jgi:hypothetical protein
VPVAAALPVVVTTPVDNRAAGRPDSRAARAFAVAVALPVPVAAALLVFVTIRVHNPVVGPDKPAVMAVSWPAFPPVGYSDRAIDTDQEVAAALPRNRAEWIRTRLTPSL